MPEMLRVKDKMNFNLIGTTHPIVETVADKVIVPTNQGGVMILKNRAPLFLAIKAGTLWLYNKGQAPACYFVSNGLAEVRRDICTVLAFGVKRENVNPTLVAQDLAKVTKSLLAAKSDSARAQIQAHIDYLNVLSHATDDIAVPDFGTSD